MHNIGFVRDDPAQDAAGPRRKRWGMSRRRSRTSTATAPTAATRKTQSDTPAPPSLLPLARSTASVESGCGAGSTSGTGTGAARCSPERFGLRFFGGALAGGGAAAPGSAFGLRFSTRGAAAIGRGLRSSAIRAWAVTHTGVWLLDAE